jgi:hypothetical protein
MEKGSNSHPCSYSPPRGEGGTWEYTEHMWLQSRNRGFGKKKIPLPIHCNYHILTTLWLHTACSTTGGTAQAAIYQENATTTVEFIRMGFYYRTLQSSWRYYYYHHYYFVRRLTTSITVRTEMYRHRCKRAHVHKSQRLLCSTIFQNQHCTLCTLCMHTLCVQWQHSAFSAWRELILQLLFKWTSDFEKLIIIIIFFVVSL